MKKQSSLGKVVGDLIKTMSDLNEDLISRETGIFGSYSWHLNRVAEKNGWRLPEISREIEERGISPKWHYFNLGFIEEVK